MRLLWLVLVILAVLLYLIETHRLTMSTPMTIVIRVMAIACIVLFVLQIFGFLGPAIPVVTR